MVFRSVLGGALGTAILTEGYPFAVHYVMFIPTIMGQGTMAQQAYWISRAWNCEIMCTYAQVTPIDVENMVLNLETAKTLFYVYPLPPAPHFSDRAWPRNVHSRFGNYRNV